MKVFGKMQLDDYRMIRQFKFKHGVSTANIEKGCVVVPILSNYIYVRQEAFPEFSVENRKKRGFGDILNSYMNKGIQVDNKYGMPIIREEYTVPKGMVSFSKALQCKNPNRRAFVHFYEHDYSIERFWKNPFHYIDKLKGYAGFISPDYSTCPDMPKPLRQYNIYRNQLVGAWLQNLGFTVISNVRCSAFDDDYCLSGVPHQSVICVGAVGCLKNVNDRERFIGGMHRLVNELQPKHIVVVGQDSYGTFDYVKEKQIPLTFFSGETQRYFEGIEHE